MLALAHLFYEWFKTRSWVVWFTQCYEYNWKTFFEKVANGNVEQSKKLIQLALVIYGSIELFTNSLALSLLGEDHPYLILFPACVLMFGIMAFLPRDLFQQHNEWLNRWSKKILGWSFWAAVVYASPYLLGDEYFQKKNTAFNPQVWNTIGTWVGGFFIVVLLMLLLGKLFNWLHFRFSNLLTRGFQKFAQHCLNKNKEMPLAVFINEITMGAFIMGMITVIIQWFI